MGKIRVYELAKELEMESKDVIRRLGKMGAEVTNHMATVDDKYARMLRDIARPKLILEQKGADQPEKAENAEEHRKHHSTDEVKKDQEVQTAIKEDHPQEPVSAAPAEQVEKASSE